MVRYQAARRETLGVLNFATERMAIERELCPRSDRFYCTRCFWASHPTRESKMARTWRRYSTMR
jgi:hypothetical protein